MAGMAGWRAAVAAGIVAGVTTGCASTPEPAESALVCPRLVKEDAADQAAFYAASPLHKKLDTEIGPQVTAAALGDINAGRAVPRKSGLDNLLDGMMARCVPAHGEAACRSATAAYAAYHQRYEKRSWERIRHKCSSRGHG